MSFFMARFFKQKRSFARRLFGLSLIRPQFFGGYVREVQQWRMSFLDKSMAAIK